MSGGFPTSATNTAAVLSSSRTSPFSFVLCITTFYNIPSVLCGNSNNDHGGFHGSVHVSGRH